MSNTILSQASELIDMINKDSPHREITIFSNISSLIFDSFDHINWAGFYYVEKDIFALGPFQGKVACTNIKLNKGMLGKCLNKKSTLNIKDVRLEKEHIACDSASLSELVIPIRKNNKVYALLDIDSNMINNFDGEKVLIIEKIASIIENAL